MKLPISIDLAAVSWANYMSKRLVRFKEGRKGEARAGRDAARKSQQRSEVCQSLTGHTGRGVMSFAL